MSMFGFANKSEIVFETEEIFWADMVQEASLLLQSPNEIAILSMQSLDFIASLNRFGIRVFEVPCC